MLIEQIAFQLVEKYGAEELEKLVKYLGMLLTGVKGAAPQAVSGPTGTAVDGLVEADALVEAAPADDSDDDDDSDSNDDDGDFEEKPAPAKKAPAKRAAARNARASKATAKADESDDSGDADDDDMDF